jgi:preprotein translocase subunit Sss1
MAKTIALIMGIVFILVGLVGFVSHNFLGTHLSMAHNLIHLISGAVSLYLGLRGTLSAARLFCLIFGGVYLLLGIVGFLLGTGAERLFTLIPGQLELGTMDHIVHVLIGVVYLIGGFLTRAVTTTDEVRV